MTKPANFNIHRVVEQLIGNCYCLTDAVSSIYGDEFNQDILEEDDMKVIEKHLFRCAACGWWYEHRDQASNGIECKDCAEEK